MRVQQRECESDCWAEHLSVCRGRFRLGEAGLVLGFGVLLYEK